MRRHGGALLGLVIAMLAFAPTASATVYVSRLMINGSYSLYVTGDDTSQDVNISLDESDYIVSGTGLAVGSNCNGSSTVVRCSKSLVTLAIFSMGAGDDKWTGGIDGIPVHADGGAGNDTIPGGAGNDTIHGGTGDDLIYGRGGSDEIFGDADNDTVDYSGLSDYVNNPAYVRISLDDVANDEVQGTNGINIHSDVENVIGTIGPDQISGSAAVNRLVGGPGADTIVAEDAVADTVECGDGADTAQVDKLDTVTACETLQGSGVPTGDSPPATDPGSSAPGETRTESPTTPVTTLPPTRVLATIQSRFKSALRTVVLKLIVTSAPPPASIHISCSGKRKGCPFKSRALTPESADTSLTKLFKKATLRPGAVIEIRVTQPSAIGKVFRFTIRRKKGPTVLSLCLAPGATAPSACS